MPTTRKKVIKTVYKDDEDSEDDGGDFSDSGSEAEISPAPSSDEELPNEDCASSEEEFINKRKIKPKSIKKKPTPFAKDFINKINKQSCGNNEEDDFPISNFSVKDLTEADKLLPSFLNLSESDSSDDETSKPTPKTIEKVDPQTSSCPVIDDDNTSNEYKDVWSTHEKEISEEIAKKAFSALEKHKEQIEKAKLSVLNYSHQMNIDKSESDVKDLLALGEEVETVIKTKKKKKKNQDQSDSDVDDWEEVNEGKSIPQQGLQLIVDLPNTVTRKTKKVDVEMMMKRKMNRVKKEYQVYMHKVHVLCWLGHGNFISRVLNDQEIMAAALSLVPSKECYPGDRVGMKYVEQITSWYKDKLTLKQDKNEGKFRPKAPPLKDILLQQIKSKSLTSKKYVVYIFIAMLRAIGLQCRVMLNFVTVPIRPPASELHSLSTKNNDKTSDKDSEVTHKKNAKSKVKNSIQSKTIPQLDGNYDDSMDSSSDFENIVQIDGNNDEETKRTRTTRGSTAKVNKKSLKVEEEAVNESVSPPKRPKRSVNAKAEQKKTDNIQPKKIATTKQDKKPSIEISKEENKTMENTIPEKISSRGRAIKKKIGNQPNNDENCNKPIEQPKIVITTDNNEKITSCKFFTNEQTPNKLRLSRKRSHTANPTSSTEKIKPDPSEKVKESKARAKSIPARSSGKSKYFNESDTPSCSKVSKPVAKKFKQEKHSDDDEDQLRVSHKDLSKKKKVNTKNDVTGDLVQIIKKRVKEAKADANTKTVKDKHKEALDDDSDYLPEEDTKPVKADSDDDFKPIIINPKTGKKAFRINTKEEDVPSNRIDVWCEVFVEELEEWIAVDVIRSKVHLINEIYAKATHPVTYVVGWDNNNYLKDLTRRYVPQWNTVTRKQRAEVSWWNTAVKPWLGPKTARDKEEDERLDRKQLEAPLPKSIAEYKNHPLYALKRHLLKYEAIFPPDASTLGFVRGEPVYARECVYVCRSRDTWLKEAKVVKLAEKPYKVVKARPKWDKLSNKLITDKPLEIFGPWQVQDYEPPVAENGIVPRNAYGNVELFKECMLPKGTVHIKLPGLNRIAKKLNIDCAPAMTGFDFNGGWSHPVFEGFVVCTEFAEIIKEAWVEDQEDLERREREKIDSRVYGNWRRLIKGLLIRERLKMKYGFEDPSETNKKKAKGPRLVVKKTK